MSLAFSNWSGGSKQAICRENSNRHFNDTVVVEVRELLLRKKVIAVILYNGKFLNVDGVSKSMFDRRGSIGAFGDFSLDSKYFGHAY